MQGVPFSTRKAAMDAAACTWTATGDMVCQKEPLNSMDVMESYAKGLYFPSPAWSEGWDRADPLEKKTASDGQNKMKTVVKGKDVYASKNKSVSPSAPGKSVPGSRPSYVARSRPIPIKSTSSPSSKHGDEDKTMLEAFWDERMKMGGDDDVEDEDDYMSKRHTKGRETFSDVHDSVLSDVSKSRHLSSKFYEDDDDDEEGLSLQKQKKKEGFTSSKDIRDEEEEEEELFYSQQGPNKGHSKGKGAKKEAFSSSKKAYADAEDYDYEEEPFTSLKTKKDNKKEMFYDRYKKNGPSYVDDEDDEKALVTPKAKKELFSTELKKKGPSYFDEEDEEYLTEKFTQEERRGSPVDKKKEKSVDQKKSRDDDYDFEGFSVRKGSKVRSGAKSRYESDDEEQYYGYKKDKSKKIIESFVDEEDEDEDEDENEDSDAEAPHDMKDE